CDLSFPGNKLVSGEHCKITVDEESGHVSLEDTSTNGTVINKMKVVKKQSCRLQNGDVIYVVYRKNEPEQNVAYLYKSLNPAQDHTQEPAGMSVLDSRLQFHGKVAQRTVLCWKKAKPLIYKNYSIS
ncbi:hypothetical protein FKM82_029924, partial [Ascaphus truei]